MGLVATWLKGIGLEYAVPSFVAAGVDTPSALSAISVDCFEALGVTDSEDRRKLFFLIQRIKMAVEQKDDSMQQVDGVLAKTMGGNKALTREESLKPDLEMSPKLRNDNITYDSNPSVTAAKENDDSNHIVLDVTCSPKQSQQQQQQQQHRHSKQKKQQQQQQHRLSPRNQHSHAPNKTPQELLDDLLDDDEDAYLTPQEDDDNDDDDDDDNNITSDKDDDSDWEEEEEEEEFADTGASADDEASSVPDRTRRVSQRLLEKQRSTATADSTTEDEDFQAAAATPAAPAPAPKLQQQQLQQRRRRQSQLVQPPKRSASAAVAAAAHRKSDNNALMNHQKNSRTTDSSAAESSSGGEYVYNINNTTSRRRSSSSGLPMPASRRSSTMHKQQQHKPKSMRTGKQLSAIPANSVAPMSPLVDLKMNSPQKGERRSQQPVGNRRRSSSTDSLSRRRSLTARRSSSSVLPQRHAHDSSSAASQSPQRRQSFSRQSRSMSNIGRNNNNRRASSVLPRNNNNNNNSSSNNNTSFKAQIEALQDENNADYELFDRPDDADSLDNIEEMRIRVVVRKRPMSTAEIAAAGDIDVIHPLCYTSFGKVLVYHPKTKVDLTKSVETLSFAFDNVFDEYSTNVQIYERTVRPLIPSLFEGQWASVFAYGQTGSGKTFTMMGNTATGGSHGNNNNNNSGSSSSNAAQDPVSNLGLYYMAALDLFQAIQTPGFEHYRLAVSLFEIYGGKLLDLLNDRTQIKCLEDSQGKIRFPGLTEHAVATADDLMTLIEDGGRNRSTGTTSRNADSSRSHAVLQLHLMDSSSDKQEQQRRWRNNNHGATTTTTTAQDEFSRLTFIDLAGSERGADTATSSRATQLEGAEINTSLLALKEVIRALATGDSMVHVPFRGSKLTQVLKESFVGKEGRSVMIACVSPNIGNVETTLNTLRYADRVKERNAETGEVAIKINNNNNSSSNNNDHVRTKNIQRDRNVVKRDDDGDDDDDFAKSSSHSADSNTSGLLDELLASPDASMTGKSSSASRQQSSNNNNLRKIAERLVADHKSAVQTMLAMVKDEMDLVNEADGDRNGLGDYITKLSNVHEEQLSIIASLRQHLLDFRMAQSAIHDDDDDDFSGDSFEDLRD